MQCIVQAYEARGGPKRMTKYPSAIGPEAHQRSACGALRTSTTLPRLCVRGCTDAAASDSQGSTRVAVMVPLIWAMTLLSSNGSAGLAADITAVTRPV
jgi:hypothetical protein